MAKFTEVLKILFPESQIVDSAKERGFIARKQQQNNYVQASGQTYSNSSVQQQSASVTPPQTIQPVANSAAISGGVERSVSRDAYTPTKIDEKNNIKANNVFEDLPELLKNYWVGSEKDRISLSKAFQRPFVMGFDNRKPKNAILIIGSDSRGKAYAIRCIGALLKQKKVFRYAEVSKLDFMDYASDGSNGLFLSDLYKALNTNTEATIFENIENASLGQLDIIYQLLTEGLYKLSKRYMVNKGGLIEATGVLNTELVSEISSNGKFFVLTSKESEGKVVSQLGNKFVKEIGDIISRLPAPKKRKYTLNFAVTSKSNLDPVLMDKYFDKEKCIIKITPIHETHEAVNQGYEIIKDFDVYEKFEKPLVEAGWQVIVFIPSEEEDSDRITCGNSLIAKASE